MAVNLDKPHLWKEDTQRSGDFYNDWFLSYAPKAFRDTRVRVTTEVERAINDTNDFLRLGATVLRSKPGILRTLRMSCCPPIAVDRLVGLSNVSKNLVASLEKGKLPERMPDDLLNENLGRICRVVRRLLDRDLFVWIDTGKRATARQRHRASTVVADRLTGADANPLIRNAQERRQLHAIQSYLAAKGYKKRLLAQASSVHDMPRGTFAVHYNVVTGRGQNPVNVSVDVVVQPTRLRKDKLPLLIEAKSAGDFTNTNKRRKEEAKKFAQLKSTLGEDVPYILFLCGYFDAGYLGYEAQDGIDWVWEHRIDDLEHFGV